MTWEEWVESAFNTDGYTVKNSYIYSVNNVSVSIALNKVLADDIIESNNYVESWTDPT